MTTFQDSLFATATKTKRPRAQREPVIRCRTSKAGNAYIEIRDGNKVLFFGGVTAQFTLWNLAQKMLEVATMPTVADHCDAPTPPARGWDGYTLDDVLSMAEGRDDLPAEKEADSGFDVTSGSGATLADLSGGALADLRAQLEAAGLTITEAAPKLTRTKRATGTRSLDGFSKKPAPIIPGQTVVTVAGRGDQLFEACPEPGRRNAAGNIEYRVKPLGRPTGQRRWYERAKLTIAK